jgi:hypothetical protein
MDAWYPGTASELPAGHLAQYGRLLVDSPAAERWCIFDNTASGAAVGNALDFRVTDARRADA